jgi:hypothetical protein
MVEPGPNGGTWTEWWNLDPMVEPTVEPGPNGTNTWNLDPMVEPGPVQWNLDPNGTSMVCMSETSMCEAANNHLEGWSHCTFFSSLSPNSNCRQPNIGSDTTTPVCSDLSNVVSPVMLMNRPLVEWSVVVSCMPAYWQAATMHASRYVW